MRSFTRKFALLITLMLVVGMAGPQATAHSQAKMKLGFVVHVKGNPFIQQIVEGAQAAAKDLNVDLVVGGPEGGDPDAQLKAVQDIVAAGAQGVAASVPGESMANGLNDIIKSGIPVVQFNLISTKVKAPYVGEKSTESGRILGKMIVDKLGGEKATGKVIIGNCFPGFPALENRAKGVQESLAKAPGLKVLGPFDVKVDAVENYSHWEQQYAANTDVAAMIGLCAPDIASLGKLNKDKGTKIIMGGYDLTEDNLKAIKGGYAYVTLGQSPFVQGYVPVRMLVDSLKNKIPLDASFYNAGTQVVTADSVNMGNTLPPLSFDELLKLSADPAATAKYYAPFVKCMNMGWACSVEPIANEGK